MTPSPQPNVGPGAWDLYGVRFWGGVVVTGVGTGLAAGLLMRLLRAVQALAWGASGSGDFLNAVQRTGWLRRVLVVLAAGALVAGLRWLLRFHPGAAGRERVVEHPGAHAGGLTAAIWFHAGYLPPLRTLAGAIGSIVVVGLGAALGREAAPKEAGALIGGLYARLRIPGGGMPPTQRRLLVACGAGAGMAAVYTVPLGGALFALEVLLGTLALPLVPPALATSLLATASAWLLLPGGPTYDIAFLPATPGLIAWSLLAGPVIGLAAVLYVRLICWADTLKPKGWRAFAAPLAVFAGLGGAAILLPQLLGNGKDVVQLAFSGALPLGLVALLAVLRPVATAACLGSGAPGGMFTPTLTFGALAGLLGGQLWETAWLGSGGVAAGNTGWGELGGYAIVGAGAMLAATTQGPISAIVLLLELTRRLDTLMVPLMLAVAGAVLVARSLESRSLYSGRIHVGRLLAERAPGETISAAARYPELLKQAAGARSGRLHVIDQDGTEIGTLDQAQIAAAEAGCTPTEIATARDFALARGSGPG